MWTHGFAECPFLIHLNGPFQELGLRFLFREVLRLAGRIELERIKELFAFALTLAWSATEHRAVSTKDDPGWMMARVSVTWPSSTNLKSTAGNP